MTENILNINNLCKEYPTFKLDNISFSMKKGTIMGFIGRNGAGKTTTLKSIMNFVHPTSGDVSILGMNFFQHEKEIKENIGYASGGINFYQRKKIKTIVDINKRFYSNWDTECYNKYMKLFMLDENKKLFELSAGMQVKFNLVLALSHHAKLLILDEPTSGLDPVSREDLLEVFLSLVDNGVSILFSTHITSDLDKCAEYITYIKQGKILASLKTKDFLYKYLIVKVDLDKMTESLRRKFIGVNRTKDCFTGLIEKANKIEFKKYTLLQPTLEDIMIHIEKE